MERGEASGSGSKPHSDDEIWAKLVPTESRYEDFELQSSETLICSHVKSTSIEKQDWCKITRNSDLYSATLQNKSSNDILVDEAVVGSGEEVIIKCGSEIVPGPAADAYMCYKFEVMPQENSCSKKLKIFLDSEHAKCCICLNVWHNAVTAAPCLHSFCNGCFSEWLRRSQEKHASVLCPQCRAVVQFVGRNHFLQTIEEDILKADPSLKRTDEEVALLESYELIKSPLILNTGKRSHRKRQRLLPDEDSYLDTLCPQCGNAHNGFQCNPNTVHLQCQACGGMMPSRTNVGLVQNCLGCDRAFCGAYWQSQQVVGSDMHPVCSPETFKPIAQRTITRIPYVTHEKNRHEQDITEKCIRQTGRALQDVVSEWIVKLDNREIDRSRMPLNHAEMIGSGTYTCNDCFEKLVSFLLYWFRVSMPKHLQPPEAVQREDCWYGYSCRTQHRSEDHARKRNHVCRPTRGNNV